jgi:hypothetical protein
MIITIYFLKPLDLDDNDTILMEPDEIACLASTNVPEGSYDECTRLTNDLWEYGQSHSVPAILINKETATKYQQSLEGRTGVITCHLELASLDGTDGSTSALWKREDCRVSKEKFDVKFYLNYRNEKLSVQHSPPNDKCKYKIDVAFNKVMGMEIADGVLRADVFGTPSIEKKPENSRLWQAVSSSNTKNNRYSRLTIVFIHRVTPVSLQQNLQKIPFLESAFHTGICNEYPGFDPTKGENPHERLPILRDPTLVRAAQLAILRLRNHSQSIQLIVETFGGIERRFHELLMKRLVKRSQLPAKNQHEE